MPDPVWSSQYNFSSTPEANGFTRVPYGTTAVVTATTTGPQAGRRLAVAETDVASGVSFITSNVPSLDASIGATGQATVAVSGAGDAGFELRFLSYAVGLSVFADHVSLDLSSNATPHVEVPTAANTAATTFRTTVDGTGTLRVYRAAAILGTFALDPGGFPSQSVQFWGESGGTQAFTAMMYYLGGAVPPG